MISSKMITRTAICISLGVLLSMIKIFGLPFGGSVTFCSTLFIALPGYWFGPAVGIIGGVIAGLTNFIFDPVFFHPLQFFLDYVLAFACLGFTGIFRDKKKYLLKGYLFAVFLKFVCNFISGIIFFKSYAPENFSFVLYSLVYNLSFASAEACISVILICLPVFKNILEVET